PQAQLPQVLLRPVLFGVGIVLVGAAGVQLEAGSAVALNAGATAVALGASLFLLRRAAPASAIAAPPEFERTKWKGAVRSFLVISAAQLVLSQQADILVVGTLLSPRDAGLYSAASQMVVGTAIFNLALTFVLTPAFGAVGAAAATVAAGFTRVGLLSWYARRYVGVAVRPFITKQPAAEGA